MKNRIIGVLLVGIMLMCSACGTIGESKSDVSAPASENDFGNADTELDEQISIDAFINQSVEVFNSESSKQLVFSEEFIPSDKNSGHYRTEFRLNAYSDAVGKSYTLDDATVDLVASETYSGDVNFRVYADGITLEQVLELMKHFSQIMDSNLSDEDLQIALDKIATEKTANGYYYGNVGLLLLGNDSTGYELMIKND